MRHSSKKGFTLIEVLVVVGMLIVLASIMVIVTQEPRARARDARRIQELQQLRKVLELYRIDHGLYPPSPPNSGGGNYGYWESSNTDDWQAFQNELSEYTSILPVDPINNVTNANCSIPGWDAGPKRQCLQYRYASKDDGNDYDLIAHLESNSNPSRCWIKHYIIHSDKLGSTYTDTVWCAPPRNGFPAIYADH